MRKGPLITTILVIFIAATAVLLYVGRDGQQAASADAEVVAAPTTSQPPPTTEPPPAPLPTPLQPGDTPPQFVLFSLDGTGDPEVWRQVLAAAEGADARITAFITGLTLIEDEHRGAYTAPGHDTGAAAAPFGGDPAAVATQIDMINAAFAAGHEIGTHYNGHFCASNPPGGDEWTSADWGSELDQFFAFLENYESLNANAGLPVLTVGPADIRGGRTPCLEGDLAELTPVWRDHDMTYDSSKNLHSGIAWPKLIDGVWEFQIPYAYASPFGRNVTLTDDIMRATYRSTADDSDYAGGLATAVTKTYRSLFKKVYHGSRAPLVIGMHAHAGGDTTLVTPTLEFMAETCGKADVICGTFSEAVAWLDAQDPGILAQLEALPAVAEGK